MAAAALLAGSFAQSARAAPPVAILMEELGYFPVRGDSNDKNGKPSIIYVPARVQRESSEQALALADYMRDKNIVMAGAYWCPHCRRQRELLGRQAVPNLYRECAVDGYGFDRKWCQRAGVTGFPSWVKDGTQVVAVGEMPLERLAQQLGYPGTIDPALESNLPPMLGSAACKLPARGEQ